MYFAVLIGMTTMTKVRFVRTVLVEVEKTRLQEYWDKQFNRWDELVVDGYELAGNFANLHKDGDIYWNVPRNAIEFVKGEPPRPF